jgi:adenosylcobinamide-phosphate synthase
MSILIALCLDWLFGEPPVRLHPVVWMGQYLKFAERGRAVGKPRLAGGLSFILGAVMVTLIAWGMEGALHQIAVAMADRQPIARPITLLLTALLLKPTFAFRLLVSEVRQIEAALQQDLDQGRQRLAYIVSRPTHALTASEVRESALESLSENLSDSVMAPLFWFVLLGLPGAYLYRYVNTADAMWGYRNERYEQWGKLAARTDDLLNYIPARITGLALLYGPALMEQPSERSGTLGQLRQEARKTPSPNSGWSMAALALRLGIRLGKPGVYVLNPIGRVPDADRTAAALTLTTQIGTTLTLGLAILNWFIHHS